MCVLDSCNKEGSSMVRQEAMSLWSSTWTNDGHATTTTRLIPAEEADSLVLRDMT